MSDLLLRASAKHGLREDDPIHAVVAAQAELLDSLSKEIRDMRQVAERVREVGHWLCWQWTAATVVLSAVAGAAATYLIEHHFFK